MSFELVYKATFDVKCGAEDFELFFVAHNPIFRDFGPYFGPIPPTCPNAPNIKKQVRLNPQSPLNLDKASFDVKCGAEDFEYFFVLPYLRIGILGPILAQFSQIAVMPQIH